MFRPLKGHPQVLGIKKRATHIQRKTALLKPITIKTKTKLQCKKTSHDVKRGDYNCAKTL
jgi:hypothetical protein